MNAIVLTPSTSFLDDLLQAGKDFLSMFAIAYSTTIRNNRLTQVQNAIDGGAGAGLLRIYDGSRPAGPGTAITSQVLLAELTCNASAFAAAASGGVLTLNAITSDSSADATGTATWFRLLTSGATAHIDGSVTATGGGGDLELSSTSIVTGVVVAISTATLTAGNA